MNVPQEVAFGFHTFVQRAPTVVTHNAISAANDLSMSEEDSNDSTDMITGFNNGNTISKTKKESKDSVMLLDMALPTYDKDKSLLLQQRVPGLEDIDDDDEKYRKDVASRPSELAPGGQAYNQISVHHFGTAYMRTLGWQPGAPIGKSNKAVVDVITFVPRPQGLGLGAKVNPQPGEGDDAAGANSKSKKRINKPGEKYAPRPQMELPVDKDGKVRHYRKLDEKLQVVKEAFYKGAPVYIKEGRHSGLKGTVVGRNGQDSILVRLSNDERVSVLFDEVDQLDDRDVIIRRRRAEEEEREARKLKERESQKSSSSSTSDRKRKRDNNDSNNNDCIIIEDKQQHQQSKRSKKDTKDHKKTTKNSKSTTPNNHNQAPFQPWVLSDIRVKITSKTLADGKYYCKAGWIHEVLREGRCVVKLESPAHLLEGVKQEDLETVVPPVGGHVVILRGERRREKGVILERDSHRNKVVVQLEEELDVIMMKMDDVAQYR